MNDYGKSIVLKVNDDKILSAFYALGFEPKEIMEILYQAIIKLCDTQDIDPALQLMQLMVAAEARKERNESKN